MGHVFVSYSRRDKELVDRIVRLMFRAAIHVWIDRENIRAGKTWRVQIVEAIDTCDVFILLLSSNSAASDNVRREIDLAHDAGRIVIPVMLERVKIPADIRYQLAGLQFINFESLGYDVAVRQLIDTVKAYRTKLAPQPQPAPVRQMELVIQGIDLASFGEGKKAELIEFIAKLANTNKSNLAIAGLAAGSVHVFIDMPADTAYKLQTLALNREKRFKQLGITSLRLQGHSKFVNIGLGILTTTATLGALHLLWLSLPSMFPSLFGITVGKAVLVTTAVVATTAVTAVSVDMATHPDHRYVAFNPIEIFNPATTETVVPTLTTESLEIVSPFTETPTFRSTPNSVLDSSESFKNTLTPTEVPATLVPGPSLFGISNVQVNSTGNIADVNAGSSVSISLDYQIWNQPDCPGCIDQIVVGLDSRPLYCAYEGIPGLDPGETGSHANTFTAPTANGSYTLYAFFTQQYSCTDALSLYSPGTAIGTLNVSGTSIDSYLRGDGDNSCPAGYTLATYSDASNDKDRICSVLDTWDIARLEGGGSIDGPGYGCTFRSFDERSLGNSVCKESTAPAVVPASLQWDITNVRLNNSSDSVVINPGDSISVSMDFRIWNQIDCPSCIDQIVIGLDSTALYCAYHGIPGLEPGQSASNLYTFDAPNTPGTYTLYAYFAQQYSCSDALADYKPLKAIGTLSVATTPSPDLGPTENPFLFEASHSTVANVQFNGAGSSAEVSPGSSVSISMNYEVWNQSDCPGCISQIVIGLDSTPLYCAYDGIPGGRPGQTGSNSNTITAPNAPGTYTLYEYFTQQFSCSDALGNYSPGKAIGTLTISTPQPSYSRGDGDNSCPAGSTLATYADALANTDLICSMLDTWDIARLEGGGSFDGPGYGCTFRSFDDRSLGNSVCKMP